MKQIELNEKQIRDLIKAVDQQFESLKSDWSDAYKAGNKTLKSKIEESIDRNVDLRNILSKHI